MGRVSKTFALFLTLIIAVSCLTWLTLYSAGAQLSAPAPQITEMDSNTGQNATTPTPINSGALSIPTPSAPEFTLNLVSSPYYVAPVTTMNPFTGQNETTQAGYYAENMSIVVTIKNQPFSYSYNGTTYQLYYDVRVKGHFADQTSWSEFYSISYQTSSFGYYSYYISPNGENIPAPLESTSDYTVLSYLIGPNSPYYPLTQIPSNSSDSQIDFQVEAWVGHNSTVWVSYGYLSPLNYMGYYQPAVAFDKSSAWSGTQTITIPASSNSSLPSPSPSSSPSSLPQSSPSSTSTQSTVPAQSVPEFPATAIVILPILLSVFTVAAVLRHRKKAQPN